MTHWQDRYTADLHYTAVIRLNYRPYDVVFFQILYSDHCKYLFQDEDQYLLIQPDGSIKTNRYAQQLGRKIMAYTRIVDKEMREYTIDSLVRIDEVEYILTEFLDPQEHLYRLNYPRLSEEIDRQIELHRLRPIDLFLITYHYEFIYDSLILNLGLPEQSENYYHKLNRTINRLLEILEFLDSDMNPLHTFTSLFSNLLRLHNPSPNTLLLIKGKSEYLVLQNHEHSGIDGLVIKQEDLALSTSSYKVVHLTKELLRSVIEKNEVSTR